MGSPALVGLQDRFSSGLPGPVVCLPGRLRAAWLSWGGGQRWLWQQATGVSGSECGRQGHSTWGQQL